MENKNVIRITESQLRQLVSEAVIGMLNESCAEGDGDMQETWNQFKTGAKTFFSRNNAGRGLGGRFQQAKANYQTQGKLDDMKGLISQLSALLDQRKIDPNTTVGQLVGGKYNGNRFGTMTGMAGNMAGQMKRRGLEEGGQE